MKRNAGRVRFRDSRILTDSLGGSISPLYLPLIFGSAKRKELLGRSARKRTVDKPFTMRPQGQARNSLRAFEQNKTFFAALILQNMLRARFEVEIFDTSRFPVSLFSRSAERARRVLASISLSPGGILLQIQILRVRTVSTSNA